MLPILLGDLSAGVSLYEGYNDNVIETRPAPDMPSQRRGSPFTGAEVYLGLSESDDRNSWYSRLAARGNYYTPFSDELVGGNDGAVLFALGGSWGLGSFSSISTGHAVTLAEQNTARLADIPLLMLDPSAGRQTFVFVSNDVSFRHELSADTRFRVTVGSGARYILRDSALQAAGRGWDYAGPRVETEWAKDLSSADTGAIRVIAGMWHMPRALLDLSGRRGPSKTWQMTPLAVWTHEHSESLTSELSGGVSFALTKNEVTTRFTVAPSFSGQLMWIQDERFAQLQYGLGINTDNITLGPGLSSSVRGQYGGALGRTHAARRFVGALTTRLSRAVIPATDDSDFVAVTVGAGGLLRYALGGVVGVVVGYEGQYLNMRRDSLREDGPSTTFYRNVVYVGVSTAVSTDDGFLPLDIPRAPRR